MTTRVLLHLAGICDLREPRLREALRLHLQHQPLTLVLLAQEGVLRTYATLDGCGACQFKRCRIGCHVDLLRRMLAAYAPSLQVRIVEGQGLAPQAITRRARLIPQQPRLLTGRDLAARWPTVRVVLTWTEGRAGLRVGGWIGVGAQGPDWQALRDLGWRATPLLADRLRPTRLQQPLPSLPLPERPTSTLNLLPDLGWMVATYAVATDAQEPAAAHARWQTLRAALTKRFVRSQRAAEPPAPSSAYPTEGQHGSA